MCPAQVLTNAPSIGTAPLLSTWKIFVLANRYKERECEKNDFFFKSLTQCKCLARVLFSVRQKKQFSTLAPHTFSLKNGRWWS